MITVDLLEHLNAHYIQMILLLHVWQKVNNTILRKFFWLRHEHSCILSDFTKWFYAHLFEASVNFQDRQGRWWWHYHLIDENLFKFSDINCINELHSLIVVKLRFKMDFFKVFIHLFESQGEREKGRKILSCFFLQMPVSRNSGWVSHISGRDQLLQPAPTLLLLRVGFSRNQNQELNPGVKIQDVGILSSILTTATLTPEA